MSAATESGRIELAAEAARRVDAVLDRIAAADRPEVFLALRDREVLVEEMTASLAAGGRLAGRTLAVKNNIDVAGVTTTAACPGYERTPGSDARAVARLRAAGAVVVGCTNLDQFATGLVGTRSPYGAVRAAHDPDRISGGSSSGSAVAVALGLVDLALGTDTAGSGRVPAALNGIVGIKPTLGVVSTDGVVPACASYDCVTVFARRLHDATGATAVMAGGGDTRPWPTGTRFGAPEGARLAVFSHLPAMDPAWERDFRRVVDRSRELGHEVVEVDPEPFLAAARLLYDGALVAERYDAVGEFLDSEAASMPAAGVDPVVAGIITAARGIGATALLRDRARVDELRREAMTVLDRVGAAALLVPTAPFHPTLQEVAADPVSTNARMGTYTNFCNLFDLCGVAVPARLGGSGPGHEGTFGVTVLGRAFDDAPVAAIAGRLAGSGEQAPESGSADEVPWPIDAGAPTTELAVFGAHRRGGPLVHQLTGRGAAWRREVRTSGDYRMFRLDTEPPKPGVVRDGSGGGALLGEVWVLSPAALGEFLAELPRPMQLGRVTLDDGGEVVGFGCEPAAVRGAVDLTDLGEWPM